MRIARRVFLVAGTAATLLGACAARARRPAAANLPYGPDARHRVDLFTPETASSSPRPVVVVLHGGAWIAGSKDSYDDVGSWLAAHGCVAVVASYRLFPAVTYPAFVDDGAAAFAWAKANAADFGGDPNRVFLLGHSAGAHIAALVALEPRYLSRHGLDSTDLAGVIGVSGPYGLGLARLLPVGTAIDGWEEMMEARPLAAVREGAPPMLLVAGSLDAIALPREARTFATALRAEGNVAQLIVVPGFGHVTVLWHLTWRDPIPGSAGRAILDFVGA